MTNYFWDGLLHFIFAIIFTILFRKLIQKDNLFKNFKYLTGLIFTSSALFFLPYHIGNSSIDKIYQFLHYPLPDWDILILGMDWHRFFITHSFLIPFILMIILMKKLEYEDFILGMCLGLSSHLIWDGISCSMKTSIIFIVNFL